MKFKIDENLPADLAADLRALGHDADTVTDECLEGAPDPVVIAEAHREGRILMTLDKGIANLIRYPAASHAGVALFRRSFGEKRGACAARQSFRAYLGPYN